MEFPTEHSRVEVHGFDVVASTHTQPGYWQGDLINLAQPTPFTRLTTALHRRGLLWLQRDLRGQLAATQADLDEATAQAIALSRLHRCNPALQELRRGLRAERDTLEQRLKIVGADLAALGEGRAQRARLSTLLITALAAAALVLAACGGGGDEQPEQPEPHPPVDCTKQPEACK